MKNKPLILIGNKTNPDSLAVALQQGIDSIPASIGTFASGEPFVELFPKEQAQFANNADKIKGRDVIVLQSGTDSMTQTLMMTHTLRTYGAGHITVVLPFAPLMRQDRAFDERFVSLGASFLATQLKAAGADAVITMTPHSQAAIKAYQNIFGDAFKAISSTTLFADDIKAAIGHDPAHVIVGAPDGADKAGDEGQNRARRLAQALFNDHADHLLFHIAKTHTGVNDTKITGFKGDVRGKDCVIIDDMIDGGSTILNAARLLKEKGARSVTACASHGILSGNALEKILTIQTADAQPLLDKLLLTDTLPDVADKVAALQKTQPAFTTRVKILSATPVLLEAAQNIRPQAKQTRKATRKGPQQH